MDAAASVDRCPDDTPAFSATPDSGLVVVGLRNVAQARVISAMPAQPERFQNDWTVRFSDAAGAAIDDVSIVDACAFMPVHGHGGAPKAVSKIDAGTFALTGLNLFMRGPWEVQLAVSRAAPGPTAMDATACDRMRQSLGNDLLTFRVCIYDD